MEGKLIKRGKNHYNLYTEKELYTSTYQWTRQGNLLSDKNCQAIENGYDLEGLALKESNLKEINPTERYYQREKCHLYDMYTKGFQKAMELMEGKKYSEEDIQNAIDLDEGLIYQTVDEKGNVVFLLDEEVLTKSLQPKEWEVEIVTKPFTEVDEGFELIPKREPKLDKDGCLILKRK